MFSPDSIQVFAVRGVAPPLPFSKIKPARFLLRRQQSKHAHTGRGAHVNLAVGDHGRDVFVSAAKLISPVRRLIGVVDFHQRSRVVSVKHGPIGLLSAHTIAFLPPFAETLGVIPGYPNEFELFDTAARQQLRILELKPQLNDSSRPGRSRYFR